MTNEELYDDLKQFITATVSQATADLATKQDIAVLRAEMNERFETVDDRFDEVMNAVGTDLKDHDQRITRLEGKLA